MSNSRGTWAALSVMVSENRSVLAASRRPLTAAERRLVRQKIRHLAGRGRRAARVSLPLTGGMVILLWLWTMWASDAPRGIITGFWLLVGGAIALWVRRDMRGHAGQLRETADRFASALDRNAADVYDVRARAFAEFEEVEDEGACYAFELTGNRLVFISGQEFYEGTRFPSLDFSLVYILDGSGAPVDMTIEKRGPKAAAARLIPAASKPALDIPDHLEVRPGTIDDLDRILGGPPPTP